MKGKQQPKVYFFADLNNLLRQPGGRYSEPKDRRCQTAIQYQQCGGGRRILRKPISQGAR